MNAQIGLAKGGKGERSVGQGREKGCEIVERGDSVEQQTRELINASDMLKEEAVVSASV